MINKLSQAMVVVGICAGVWCVSPVAASEIVVAAASDLSFAMKEITAEYERASGHAVKLSLGSSGHFFSQIQNGAPYDLYFSADIDYPRKLQAMGHTLPGTLYRYAVGRIVVWVRTQSPLAVERLGLEVLLDPSIHKIAIANPRHAPYGRAAKAALEGFGLYERVKPKLVLGENISQAAQFVQSGASDIGIIALSLALAPAMKETGRYWIVPADAHPPLEQAVILLKGGRNQAGARDLLTFVQGPRGQAIMQQYGFTPPDDSAQP
ncbi:MAG: molybdate ABC transporter substrate-binding protein [Nitrospiraceae bacterium]